MTREEEIERASVHHLNQYDYSYEEGEHLDFYIKGFTEGAKWADEHPVNVWHDASEEPQGNNWHILCQNEMDGYCLESRVFMLNDPWKEFVEEEMIVKWAYINDLLPKKEL